MPNNELRPRDPYANAHPTGICSTHPKCTIAVAKECHGPAWQQDTLPPRPESPRLHTSRQTQLTASQTILVQLSRDGCRPAQGHADSTAHKPSTCVLKHSMAVAVCCSSPSTQGRHDTMMHTDNSATCEQQQQAGHGRQAGPQHNCVGQKQQQ